MKLKLKVKFCNECTCTCIVSDMHVDGEENLRKFWIAMVTECLRRAASRNLREINSNISHGLIDLILHGKKGNTYFVVVVNTV